MTTFEAFADLAARRRTSLLMDTERRVDPAIIRQVCEVAAWAPSHKRTWPWRFASFTGAGRALLGESGVECLLDRFVLESNLLDVAQSFDFGHGFFFETRMERLLILDLA